MRLVKENMGQFTQGAPDPLRRLDIGASRSELPLYDTDVDLDWNNNVVTTYNLTRYRHMKFGDWESAMKFLLDEEKEDEELHDLLHSVMGSYEELVIGDQRFAGSDIHDHLS